MDKVFRFSTAGVLAVAVLTASACASEQPASGPMAGNVTVENQWANAAETGMAAVFGSLANTGGSDVQIVGGNSPQAGHVEIHEVVVNELGGKTMREKDGGLTVPAGGTRELIPGGDHLMLMDLTQPLLPGADITVTLEFQDGSTLPVTAQVRDFAGGSEEYTPNTDGDGGAHHHG
ncbi:copper chaperone PCu(A)C [Mycobacterium sp. SMC-4]|uniref:copper chaperone PCu(A)C n=1 Tax=Mycobacterium sp. SMC-4 TaxID=2857059 RepID=UPI003D01264F